MTIRTLVFDIETRPALGYIWGLFDQNVGLNMLKEDDGILCWAATWAGSDETIFSSVHMTSERNMLRELYDLLEEADEVVGWNSDKFDIRWVQGQFAIQGWPPVSPFKKIDLMKISKTNFRFLSNKLDYFLTRFGVENKVKHDGFGLWVDCMAGDEAAWKKMEEYCIGDVLRTEKVYDILLPYVRTGVNRNLVANQVCCVTCGSTDLQFRGHSYTLAGSYRRLQCKLCGKWNRSNKQGDKEPTNMVNAL